MPKIHVMSDNLANKIAAGEVVEKCSSIVKELVENSIDAGSTNIQIDLVNGGLNGITVLDNGSGMEHEDALLSFKRHATSKLVREDDLFFIDTLGFRGEALPSIASVSEVDLITCATDIGTHIHIKGGILEIDEPSDSRHGTRIEVKNLFYNTPARLKYLKSEQTELANCISLIEKLALSYPYIKFTMQNNNHIVVKTSGSDDLKKTIHEIYGVSVSSKLLEINASNDDYDVYGYICKPEILKSNRNHMITIVNGRVVKNNDLNKAINDAYYTYKPDIKYPIVILNINTDPTLIDVNIHPTKQDIKMSKIESLYSLINKSIKDELYKNLLMPSAMERLKSTSDIISKEEINKIIEEKEEINKIDEETTSNQVTFDFQVSEEETKYNEETTVVNEEMKKLILYPLCQVHRTFIVAENDEGMFLIDQHAAHERINYEKFFKALKSSEVSTIPMLIPITIELTPSEYQLVKKHLDFITEMGIKIEEFGPNTFIVKEHPTWFKEGYEEEGIRRLIDLVIQNGQNFNPIKMQEKAVIMLACKMSIKANMDISEEMMNEIVRDLVKTDNPYNCPHGRPTIIKFTNYDLQRMFKRAMN